MGREIIAQAGGDGHGAMPLRTEAVDVRVVKAIAAQIAATAQAMVDRGSRWSRTVVTGKETAVAEMATRGAIRTCVPELEYEAQLRARAAVAEALAGAAYHQLPVLRRRLVAQIAAAAVAAYRESIEGVTGTMLPEECDRLTDALTGARGE
jgi:hypothetical protein